MNSYGSVALVSQSIYRVLHYLNWFSNGDDATKGDDVNTAVVESEQTWFKENLWVWCLGLACVCCRSCIHLL